MTKIPEHLIIIERNGQKRIKTIVLRAGSSWSRTHDVPEEYGVITLKEDCYIDIEKVFEDGDWVSGAWLWYTLRPVKSRPVEPATSSRKSFWSRLFSRNKLPKATLCQSRK